MSDPTQQSPSRPTASIPLSPGMQMRLNEPSPLYNPARDVAHNFKYVLTEVASRLEDGRWAALNYYLDGIPDAELGIAMQALVLFTTSAVDNPRETMEQALDRSGWMKVRPVIQIALMAYLGTAMAGVYYHGVKEATLGGQGPCCDVHDLQEAGRRTLKLLTMSRPKRIFYQAWWAVKRVLSGRKRRN